MDAQTEAQLLSQLSPTPASHHDRLDILHLLKRNIEKCLSHFRVFIANYGSFPLQTYLPGGDLDLTLIVAVTEMSDEEILRIVRKQMEFVAQIRPQYAIKGFVEVNAEVKVLKFVVRGVQVDISVNQVGGLLTLRLFEQVDSLTKDHLFKRALMITKAWATCEGRISGSQYGLLASYALGVLIICTLNSCPASRNSPVQVLTHMIRLLSDYDWENNVITCFGIIPADEFLQGNWLNSAPQLFFSASDLHTPCLSLPSLFPRKYINISDPIKPDNNLGRSVSRGNFARIKLAFQAASQRLSHGSSLFPSLFSGQHKQSTAYESGRTSPSTSSGSEEEHWQFTGELEAAEKAVRRAQEEMSGRPKPWMAFRPGFRPRTER